ncbi:MAG: hypothetical protein GXW96_02960 [Christensenellaceae bacterium]|nr:hypothetical protein [Christensenellaceae bacterium]
MLTMGTDHVDTGFIDRFLQTFPYTAYLYTLHGHTSEAPRYRIIVPLKRDASPGEYAADWGIDQFDECSYKPNHLMYWPTTPSDGEFISKTANGDWLDPDMVLAAHHNCHNCSLLPILSRESALRKNAKKPQENPLAKSGLMCAFCRTYSIPSSIDTVLSDAYAPSVAEGFSQVKAAPVLLHMMINSHTAIMQRIRPAESCLMPSSITLVRSFVSRLLSFSNSFSRFIWSGCRPAYSFFSR